jgi:hypothetical protein
MGTHDERVLNWGCLAGQRFRRAPQRRGGAIGLAGVWKELQVALPPRRVAFSPFGLPPSLSCFHVTNLPFHVSCVTGGWADLATTRAELVRGNGGFYRQSSAGEYIPLPTVSLSLYSVLNMLTCLCLSSRHRRRHPRAEACSCVSLPDDARSRLRCWRALCSCLQLGTDPEFRCD